MAQQAGFQVSGSDQAVYPPMSEVLARHGIPYQKGYSADNLPRGEALIVVGNAISRGNPELEAALNRHLRLSSLSEFLRENFIRGCTSLVITGTHGKTTTTSMTAHIFEVAGKEPGFMIAGAPGNFSVGARKGGGKFFITEGDEYDTVFYDKRSKFLHYLPDMVVINNLEFDHADIFSSLDEIKKSFRLLVNLIPSQGIVLVNGDDSNALEVSEQTFCPRLTFGTSANCDFRLSDFINRVDGCQFVIHPPNTAPFSIKLPVAGQHNARNALAAAVLALQNGIAPQDIQQALAIFIPVRRRLEKKGTVGDILIYDDFAHHPTAIALTLQTLRDLYPHRRLVAVFEPRSNTMVRNFFQNKLVESLAVADVIYCSDLHRKEKIPEAEQLNLERLAFDLNRIGKKMIVRATAESLLTEILSQTKAGDVIVVMSNGGFGGMAGNLLHALKKT